ncbi:hypothetical protein SDC9_98800 [bioreactor metagenome]|uniref:Uncharacterized protein n=1 Tax=bioreactor metagenome TaxID=1076179 RepID=A0A645AGA4_9ZZZZ
MRTRGQLVGHHRNHARQRMAHVGGGDAMFGQQFRLEREDAQHVIGAGANLVDTVGTPCPDRRAHKMHRLDARLAQLVFKAQIEIGGIDTDKHAGRVGNQLLAQFLAQLEQAQNLLQQLQAVAMHGQALALPPGVETALLHLRAANAEGLHLRPFSTQAIQQQPSKQIAGGFSGDHGYLGAAFCRFCR